MTVFRPAFVHELAIAGADGVGMDAEPAGQLPRAGQPVARPEVAAEDGKDHLRDQLTIDGDFALGGKPKSHIDLAATRLDWRRGRSRL